MDEPYDRAVAFHLIRRAARDEGLKVTTPQDACDHVAPQVDHRLT